MRERGNRRLALLAATWLSFVVPQAAEAQTTSDCEQAGYAAELQYGVPPGLLLAIGRVESGRWNPFLGRVTPWPWAIDVDGQPRMFNSSADAVTETRRLQLAGQRNIDIGCFQISLLHHPGAFADLADGFDARANAQYAAQFLTSLRMRLGSWQDAIAAYHSADPQRGSPYRQQVLATWLDHAVPLSAVVVRGMPSLGIPVWTPSPAGTAPAVIAIHANSTRPAMRLPRVITPGN